jgi:CBS domain-containing protein
LKIREIMTARVEVLRPESSVREAAQMMRDLDVGPLPVVEGDRVVGVLTDRDITIRATAEGRDPNTTPIQDVMTRNVVFCFEDDDVKEAAKLMSEKQVRRLLVMNRERQLVGIASLGDLAVDTGDEKMSGEVLEQVSRPLHQGTP